MSVTRRSLILSIALFFYRSADVAAQDFKDSLVRVYLSREFWGVFFEKQFEPQTRVREVVEFNGAVFDSRGYIISYVGSYGPDFSMPGIRVTVEATDGQQHPAQLIGVDERIALAVLESERVARRHLTFATGSLSFADGKRPFFVTYEGKGNWEAQSPSLFNVRNLDGLPEDEVQVAGLKTQSGEGNWEGGFLLNERGKLLGIITRAEPHSFTKKVEVCRVIPSSIIRSSVARILREKKNITAGWLGILLDTPLKFRRPQLVAKPRIRTIVPDSPAQKAGLKLGDVILKVEGRNVDNPFDLVRAIHWKGSGQELNLSIERGGEIKTVSAQLTHRQDKRPVTSWAFQVPPPGESQLALSGKPRMFRTVIPSPLHIGFELEALTAQLADYFRAPNGAGLLVKSVVEGTAAHKAGFMAGDVLIQINGQDVSSPSDLENCLNSAKDEVLVVQFVRDRRLRTQKLVLQ